MKHGPFSRWYATPLCATLSLVTFAACASAPATPPRPAAPQAPAPPGTPGEPALPPIPAVDGPLRLEVGYPSENGTIAARDSNFIFGSTGSGRTRLTINGAAVEVAPNGGFLAFLPVPADGVYRLNATRNGETGTLERTVRVPASPAAPTAAARILSPYPTGTWALRAGETFEVGFRGPAGAQAALLLPNGTRIPLVEQTPVAEAVAGDEFRTNAPPTQRPTTVRYAAVIPVTASFLARDTGLARPRIGTFDVASTTGGQQPLGTSAQSGGVLSRDAVLELIAGNDTARAPLRLNLAVLPADVPRTGVVTAPPDAAHDWTARGRNDISGPFHFFWPPGARLTITGEKDGLYRVRLAGNRHAWVSAGDVRLLPAGAPPASGIVASVRFAPESHWIDLRIPATERLPFHVTEADDDVLHIDVFGATSRVNFFQYGGLDPLITRAEWSQPADSVFRVTVQLSQPVWGYHTFYDPGGALVMRIRRPPVIDPSAPFRGLLIAVDPGHGGEDRATRGPTGLTEADANLYIALKLRDLLTQAGARVLMTRTTDATVPLNDRPRIAADSNAHILVSVHNNAFPDGVNPWENNGTSGYYYHPHSVELVRQMQQELLQELRLRDIGYGRADLALVRTTWMPAVLTETMFMMIPQQEAALRDPAVQERIARAHVRALEAFLQRRARR